MKKEILTKLFAYTEEELEILNGRNTVDQSLYTDDKNFVIDKDKLLLPEQLISVRKHTRFIDFPIHKHNYVELQYVYKGKLTQIIDGKQITMKEGELMMLNTVISHEIKAAQKEDIIINFIIKPEFFQYIFSLADIDNVILNFIMNTIYSNSSKGEYLYYKVSKQGSIKANMEKIITELYEPDLTSSISIKLLVGLLLVNLIKHSDEIEVYSVDNYEKKLSLDILKYIDEHYEEGSLAAISAQLNQPDYKICRIVKKYTGVTFKQLVQETRLNKASDLLMRTKLSITSIMQAVGYENITYFYKIFKEKYTMTPHEYRKMIEDEHY
ncbi:AraC family transcriptional regulator [[Eubacterium] hominis]|uniref:AraC family transcriptional regulator n=1 Tax=[Eubacterium] hominis TaxID=2764325 RepID=UPI003A4DC5B8